MSLGSILDAAKKAPMKNIDWNARSQDVDKVRTLNKSDCAELRYKARDPREVEVVQRIKGSYDLFSKPSGRVEKKVKLMKS